MFVVDHDWILTPQRVAVHRPTRTGVVADLHLGYSGVRQATGDAVPSVAIDQQLQPLKRACEALCLTHLVVAGDLSESRWNEALIEPFQSMLREVGVELSAIVPGNHDRGWANWVDRVPVRETGVRIGEWTIVHGDDRFPTGRVMLGHHHPAWRSGARLLPCYLVGAGIVVLPAFSRDAAGGAVNQRGKWCGYQVLAIDGDRVFDVASRKSANSRPRTRSRQRR